MRSVRNDQVLAAALAVLLSTTAIAVANPEGADRKSGAAASVASAQSSEADLNSRIPLPDPLNLPPPSARDAGVPASETKPVAETKPQAETKPTAEAKPAETKPVAETKPAPETAKPAATAATPPAPAQPDVAATPPAANETAAAPAVEALDPHAAKLKEVVTTRLSRFVDRKDERAGVESFYAARQYAPLFTDDGALNARGKAAIAYLSGVGADGLDPADYPAPAFKAGADSQALAEAELRLADSVITFARHAQVGRIHYSRVSADILYKLDPPDPAKVLANLAETSDVAKALDSYTPQHAGYKALKAKLAELRGQSAEPAAPAAAPTVQIPEGPIMRPGDDDPRVALLRKRLNAGETGSTRFDARLVEAVKAFQEKAGLDSDGAVGPMTLRALNSGHVGKPRGRVDTINTILANMERWRWVPRDLGKAHVILNIPAFSLKVYNNGNKVWETRVVVGKPETPTPLLTETMKYITVNPTWNVPPSIVYNEYLPALQQDPSAMARIGIKVTQNNDGTVHMYQPPGDGNALGRIRFNFPNKFLVYQHDTPDKHLFSRETRAFSHGCMRVQDPVKYGEVILSIARPNDNYSVERLRGMFGPEERDIQLSTHIPVHITYQTAFVDEHGKLVLRDDIYGRDRDTLAVLKGDRLVAELPMDRRSEQNGGVQRSAVNLPYGVAENGGSSRYAYRSEGGGFFEMLFGGPRYYQPQRRQQQETYQERRRYNTRPLN